MQDKTLKYKGTKESKAKIDTVVRVFIAVYLFE